MIRYPQKQTIGADDLDIVIDMELTARLEVTANSEDAKNLVLLFAQHIDQEITR